MKPYPTQIEGAQFLAGAAFRALGDAPRVGKTGTAIIAGEFVLASRILVVTTASGRAVWRKGFQEWSHFRRDVVIATKAEDVPENPGVVITGWPNVADPAFRAALLKHRWCVLILDEAHAAKNFSAKRTQAVYGVCEDDTLDLRMALASAADIVWPLSGTFIANSPLDLFPLLRFGAPERLLANPEKGWPDVSTEEAYLNRYCKWRPKKIGRGPYARTVRVIMEGKNTEELRERIDGLFLRRTQQDVGITAPLYDTLPLIVPERARHEAEKHLDLQKVLAAIDSDSTRELDMHLGPLRRVTGALKARAIVDLVKEEFDCGLDRIVLAFWHRDVAEILIEGLAKFGVVGIDGSTSAKNREANVTAFQNGDAKVFLAQIQAAGEAIDLSAAAEMIFVEMSSVPKDGAQMALRVTNHGQKRQPRVRVATVAGSIDEPIQNALLRKMKTIAEIMQ